MSREKFEALPEIVEILKKGVFEYSEFTKSYSFVDAMVCINARPSQHKDHGFLNGAYYAFCEQEKRIAINKELRDLLNKEIEALNNGIGKAIIALYDANNCEALDTLKELLK